MAKRFINSGIFDDPWFRKLKPNNKVFWVYLFCECDHAGIWQADFETAAFRIGGKVNLDELNNGKLRVIEISEDLYFIPDFIEFQYPHLNAETTSKAQISVINRLKQKDLWDIIKGCVTVREQLGKSYQTVLDIDKDKDKDKDKEKNKDIKIKYGEFVFLTEIEFKKLVDKNGDDFTRACIDRLNTFIGSSGKKYKSHYYTILKWVIDAENKTGEWEQ